MAKKDCLIIIEIVAKDLGLIFEVIIRNNHGEGKDVNRSQKIYLVQNELLKWYEINRRDFPMAAKFHDSLFLYNC